MRPADTVLAGQLQGSGFEDAQWLVQRGASFVQVSELLYRILELSDGTRTVEDLADAVTDSTEWQVTPEIVARVIESKLIPLGLVQTAVPSATGVPANRSRSPLSVQLRLLALGPTQIEALASRLQVLYTPPMLVALLTAVMLAHVWLYAVHGLAGGVGQLALEPSLFLLVVATIWAAAAFHELGHASALRYGGGRSRYMGAGLYLVYPTFFTDTNDAYRLRRWARVRTDLGGVYFHLIFTLGLFGLYATTGQEFLLPVVALVDFEVLRQFIPFVRLDGYWLLADLTGIPDLFVYMKPALWSLVPYRGTRRPAFTGLKPWPKRIFMAYMAVTIPALAYGAIRLVMSLPAFARTLELAFQIHLTALAFARDQGDLIGAIAYSVQVLILVLPAVGLLMLVYGLVATPVRFVWRRSLSRQRRAEA